MYKPKHMAAAPTTTRAGAAPTVETGLPEPAEKDEDLDDLSPDEAREVLIARLIAYKQFRNAGAALGARMGTGPATP